MVNILYISSLSSKRLVNKIHKESGRDPGFAVQKFNRLVSMGLKHNGANVKVYSKPPVGNVVGHTWVNESTETEDDLTYSYLSYYNVPIIRDLLTFFLTFWQVVKFVVKNRGEKAVVCDVLAVSMNLGAVLASKLMRVKIVGIVTDMPGLMVGNSEAQERMTLSKFVTAAINKSYLSSYSHYVFLTEQMNSIINIYDRPYIVMEALCDNSHNISYDDPINKAEPKVVMYAGGLHKRYGLKLLVDAFCRLEMDDVQLWLLGDGPYVEELQGVLKKDHRVHYCGVVSNEEVLYKEQEATLLVNPRPTNEEFTKYSFPSKNMEYMASGTPLLTTKLPGMPEDYYPYIYLFEDEDVDGFEQTLKMVLGLPEKDLVAKGIEAKEYVLKNKNYLVQTERILKLIKK